MHEFHEEKIILVEQKDDKLKVITVVVEPKINLWSRFSNAITSHNPIGYYYPTSIEKEYLFDKNLKLVSENEIEYEYKIRE